MNYIEAPIALPLSLDNEAMMLLSKARNSKPENKKVPGRSTYPPEPSPYAFISWKNAFVSSKKLFLYYIYYFYTPFLPPEYLWLIKTNLLLLRRLSHKRVRQIWMCNLLRTEKPYGPSVQQMVDGSLWEDAIRHPIT